MSYIEVTDVAKSFERDGRTREVLRRVSIGIERGEFVSIVGTMGSGKSTLLGIMAGLVAPDRGTVTVGGVPVTDVVQGAAFVFQNYSLLPWLSARENVRLAVETAFPQETKAQHRSRAETALERVGLGAALDRKPRQLSGGMRQRVALARAFVTEPSVLFLDEPFGALDALTRETLQQDLANMCAAREKPVTTVMVTNNLDEAILLSDRIVPMVSGPPAMLGAPLPVVLPRPRSAAALAHDESAGRTRADIISVLTSGTGRARIRPSSTRAVAEMTEPVKAVMP